MRRALLIIAVLVLVWMVWTQTGRNPEWKDPEALLDVTASVGKDSLCARNIVAMQPYMLAQDYQSKRHFYEKLKRYFEAARLSGYLGERTVVLLPEYLGTWLVVSGEKKSVAAASTITGAMALMVASNPVRFARTFFTHHGEGDRVAAAIFRMKAQEMADTYAEVFVSLAKEYRVTINAGSIVLPAPGVSAGKITTDITQPLYNSTFIFYPDGTIDGKVVKKSFPILSELPFVTAFPVEELPAFDLSIGKTVLLVCADSWYPASYDRIRALKPDVVLVCSYCAGNNTMSALWHGYDGGSGTPADVDAGDVGKLKELEAWKKYALPGRLPGTHTRYGVNVFLRGELWDLGTDGQPFMLYGGELQDVQPAGRAGIWNFCLD